MSKISLHELYEFIHEANINLHQGKSQLDTTPSELDFIHHTYTKGHFSYQDSHIGFIQSHGNQLVRFNNVPVWQCSYMGGMYDHNRDLTRKTIHFLRHALSVENPGFNSFRGPEGLTIDHWEYKYKQIGDVEEFIGDEEILHQKSPIFYYRIIGGLIIF